MLYRPMNDRPPYTGDGLECIAALRPDTNEPHVLRNVAAWHEGDYRRGARHAKIAAALYAAAILGKQMQEAA